MKIIHTETFKHNRDLFGDDACHIYLAVCEIQDLDIEIGRFLDVIRDTSWVNSMPSFKRRAYESSMKPTITKLVELFESGKKDSIGEYLISLTALDCLYKKYKHQTIPVADIFKPRKTGNEGFDFHSKNTYESIVFGEAKYNKRDSAYSAAVNQIGEMIELEKDLMELIHLENFFGSAAVQNAEEGRKVYAASFSVHRHDVKGLMDNIKKTEGYLSLTNYDELYLIGVKI